MVMVMMVMMVMMMMVMVMFLPWAPLLAAYYEELYHVQYHEPEYFSFFKIFLILTFLSYNCKIFTFLW